MNKYEYALHVLLGNTALQKIPKAGDPCIVAGYIATYGTGGSCGSTSSSGSPLNEDLQIRMASGWSAVHVWRRWKWK